MIKYKEKWDKLKESARRKKEAKAAAGAVKQPIAEDPEGEEAGGRHCSESMSRPDVEHGDQRGRWRRGFPRSATRVKVEI